jgi:phosphohistidine phosphatase
LKLYIVRHGIAVEHGTSGFSEEERPLTEEGIRKMETAAAGYRKLGVIPAVILTSPLTRARQTAEILAAEYGRKVRLEVCPELSPGGSRTRLYQEIAGHAEEESLMLVGHEPSLGEIAGEIAFGSSGCCLELKKGGGCGLELSQVRPVPRGSLLWLLPPAFLRTFK